MCVTIATTAEEARFYHAQTSRILWPQSSKFVAMPQPEMRTKQSEHSSKNKCRASWRSQQSKLPHLALPPNHGYPPRFGDEDHVKIRLQPDEFQKPEDIHVPSRAAAAPPARQLQDRSALGSAPTSTNCPAIGGNATTFESSMNSVCAIFYLFYRVFPRAKSEHTSPWGFIKFEIAAPGIPCRPCRARQ